MVCGCPQTVATNEWSLVSLSKYMSAWVACLCEGGGDSLYIGNLCLAILQQFPFDLRHYIIHIKFELNTISLYPLSPSGTNNLTTNQSLFTGS